MNQQPLQMMCQQQFQMMCDQQFQMMNQQQVPMMSQQQVPMMSQQQVPMMSQQQFQMMYQQQFHMMCQQQFQMMSQQQVPMMSQQQLQMMCQQHFQTLYQQYCQMMISSTEFFNMEKKLGDELKDTIFSLPDPGYDYHYDNGTSFEKSDTGLDNELHVMHVYNPLIYASEPHRNYLQLQLQYRVSKNVLFVGMNPGRNGMGQNGIPFGDPTYVKDWLNIPGVDTVELPPGLQCKNKEDSGHRFWGLMKDICKTPQWFFQNCFVYNYCPLLFVGNDGKGKSNKDKNIPLDQIPTEDLKKIEVHCDQALRDCIRIIQPEKIVGIGVYAAKRAHIASGRVVAKILHPSPATGKDWNKEVIGQLQNVMKYLNPNAL